MHLIFFVAALRRRTPSSVSHTMHDLSHRVACVGPWGIESRLNYFSLCHLCIVAEIL